MPRTLACMWQQLAKVPHGAGDHHLAHTCSVDIYFYVNAPYFDSTSCSGDSCYTILSTQLYICEVLANHDRSSDKTNVVRCNAIITVLSATIPVEMSTRESRSLYAKGK